MTEWSECLAKSRSGGACGRRCPPTGSNAEWALHSRASPLRGHREDVGGRDPAPSAMRSRGATTRGRAPPRVIERSGLGRCRWAAETAADRQTAPASPVPPGQSPPRHSVGDLRTTPCPGSGGKPDPPFRAALPWTTRPAAAAPPQQRGERPAGAVPRPGVLGPGGRASSSARRTSSCTGPWPEGHLPAIAAARSAASASAQTRAAAQLRHDHVVRIYHGRRDHGVPFLAMELARGETLEERLRPEPAAAAGAARRRELHWARRARCAGLIHRDGKPATSAERQRRVKILDFGVAPGPPTREPDPPVANASLGLPPRRRRLAAGLRPQRSRTRQGTR